MIRSSTAGAIGRPHQLSGIIGLLSGFPRIHLPLCVGFRRFKALDWDKKPVARDLMSLVYSRAHWQIIFGGNYYKMPPAPTSPACRGAANHQHRTRLFRGRLPTYR